MDNSKIKKLEADLWESADLLRAGSKLTSNQYCIRKSRDMFVKDSQVMKSYPCMICSSMMIYQKKISRRLRR